MPRRERQAHKALSEVTVGLAHALRNPLFGISSAAQLLRFRVKDDPVVEKNVGRILREVERLNNLAAALLEYGESHSLHLSAGDPDSVWDHVIEDHRGRLESRALLLQRTRPEYATRCRIDGPRLTQAFGALFSNTVDAAPEGSNVTLESSLSSTGAWECRVHNGGAAIAPDDLPRVFELFFTTKAGAAGIGLALCQRIIDEHDGSIAIESSLHAGTTVSISLPPA